MEELGDVYRRELEREREQREIAGEFQGVPRGFCGVPGDLIGVAREYQMVSGNTGSFQGWFRGAQLRITGPQAGLVTICIVTDKRLKQEKKIC